MVSVKLGIFLATAVATGYFLNDFADTKWGKRLEYTVTYRGGDKVADETKKAIIVKPQTAGDERTKFELAAETYGKIESGDTLKLDVRRLPVVGGDLLRYTVLRGGAAVFSWEEGASFYYVMLGGLSMAAGLAAYFIASFVFNLLKLGKGAKD